MHSKHKVNLQFNSFQLEKGFHNLITDVPGVKVGHVTLDEGDIQTGVTAILPHEGNVFKQKVTASTYVMNGFGKSIGLVQIDELGTIETPILLTNTLSVGRVATGLIQYMLEQNQDIGVSAGSVNPVVCECNDGYLNAIRGLNIKEEHAFEAIQQCQTNFEQGAVGAGRGMVCYGLKGGIGSASRVVVLDGVTYTVGMLVLTNFGNLKTLMIDGEKVGIKILEEQAQDNRLANQPPASQPSEGPSSTSQPFAGQSSVYDLSVETDLKEQGSMIAVLATDMPLNDRQLKRLLKRIPVGMARTGAHFGSGSGDVFFGFTTANLIQHDESLDVIHQKILNENRIDQAFQAVIETTEESILNSLFYASTVSGREGRIKKSLLEHSEQLQHIKY